MRYRVENVREDVRHVIAALPALFLRDGYQLFFERARAWQVHYEMKERPPWERPSYVTQLVVR